MRDTFKLNSHLLKLQAEAITMNHKSISRTTLGLWLTIIIAGVLANVLLTPFVMQLPRTLLSVGISGSSITIVMLAGGLISTIGGLMLYRLSESRTKQKPNISFVLLVALATALTLEGMLTVSISLLPRIGSS